MSNARINISPIRGYIRVAGKSVHRFSCSVERKPGSRPSCLFRQNAGTNPACSASSNRSFRRSRAGIDIVEGVSSNPAPPRTHWPPPPLSRSQVCKPHRTIVLVLVLARSPCCPNMDRMTSPSSAQTIRRASNKGHHHDETPQHASADNR